MFSISLNQISSKSFMKPMALVMKGKVTYYNNMKRSSSDDFYEQAYIFYHILAIYMKQL